MTGTNAASREAEFARSLKPRAVEEYVDIVFYRRVAHRIIPTLIKLGLSPNQVTTLSMLTGLGGAFLVYEHHWFGGAVLAIAAIVLDCCDGQMARLTGKTSPVGRAMDGLFDAIWVSALWACIYTSHALQRAGVPHVLGLLLVGAISTYLHCWRFDGVKTKYVDCVDIPFVEGNLDAPAALALAKQSLRKLDLGTAILAGCLAFQQYFFVSKEKKVRLPFSDAQRVENRAELDPIVSGWSWLGEGHHNSLVILGVLGLAFTPWLLVGAFAFIAVPMNVWYVICEARFAAAHRRCLAKLPR